MLFERDASAHFSEGRAPLHVALLCPVDLGSPGGLKIRPDRHVTDVRQLKICIAVMSYWQRGKRARRVFTSFRHARAQLHAFHYNVGHFDAFSKVGADSTRALRD